MEGAAFLSPLSWPTRRWAHQWHPLWPTAVASPSTLLWLIVGSGLCWSGWRLPGSILRHGGCWHALSRRPHLVSMLLLLRLLGGPAHQAQLLHALREGRRLGRLARLCRSGYSCAMCIPAKQMASPRTRWRRPCMCPQCPPAPPPWAGSPSGAPPRAAGAGAPPPPPRPAGPLPPPCVPPQPPPPPAGSPCQHRRAAQHTEC